MGIITSVVTIVIVYVIERKALIGWRFYLWGALMLVWIGIILITLDLILQFLFEYSHFFAIVGVAFWIVGIIIFILIFYQMCSLETISFLKNDNISFEKLESRFRTDCIDSAIEHAKKDGINFHFPVILAVDEGWMPWNIGLNFANYALENKTCVIFFTFTRPNWKILNQLENNSEKFKRTTETMPDYIKMGENLIIIDCFTPIALESKKDDLENGILFADPRNPHGLNKKYERALEYFHNRHQKKLVVIYDSLSEFLFFSDIELATQYIRHNMVWEEKINVNSLYIVRLNTLEKSLEEYILWFANVVIYLKTEDHGPLMRIRGLFKGPKNYNIGYNYKFR